MSKELKELEELNYNLDLTKTTTYINHYYDIKNALQRLESIDNSNPSEALEYLDQFINEMTYCLEHPKEYAKGYEKQIFWKYKNTFETTIKQALLKAQEPKKYLKWEDLEFKEKTSRIEVKLNETLYSLSCVKRQYLDFVYLINNDSQIRLNSANDIQLFNDLHLERVEE